MKNVYTSWDLDLLADNMIEKIMENWKSPFSSPAVVFTDAKTEQWFKLRWLKKKSQGAGKGSGQGILMNLKTLRIQQFLFDLVTPQVAAFQKAERLSVELLRDVIITKLTSREDSGTGAGKTGGKYYFESLGAPEVTTYLTGTSSGSGSSPEINANHLYDFAQTIASLFLDYEDTRPDTLNQLLAQQAWQKKLYDDVIGEKGLEIEGTKYLTLYQLTKENKKAGGGSLTFSWKADRPVFIFGFSGIGQIYRQVLDDFSKAFQLEVFLQLGDIPKEPKNQLLAKWGGFGREQFGLWSKNTQAALITSAESFSRTDSILHKTQKAIAEDTEITALKFDASDTSLTLTAAPTALREIEALHSKICHLLEKDGVQLGDILVVAPHIQNYKTSIEQVFDQNDQHAEDSLFPYIPYTIADYSGERSLTAEALTILFGIWKKGYLSRADLFSLLHNHLVQSGRGISDEDVFNWSDWVSDLNVYRDREGKKDWQKAKNRILLSRLTTDLVVPADGSEAFLPYESMTSADNEALYNFIQIIDDLESWAVFAEKKKLTSDDLDTIRTMLESWLLTGDNTPDDLYNDSLVFQNVVEEIERQKLTLEKEIYSDCFASALFDRSAAVTLHSSNILGQGITFANFESNRVLSAKYVFFMGLDSKVFPGIDSEIELDLRKNNKDPEKKKEAGDESIPEKNKNAFLCQLMAAREGFFISYINKNLQKDEDFFMSSVLKNLFETIYKLSKDDKDKVSYQEVIIIDEERPWKELYTPREFRNKNNFIKLQENKVQISTGSQPAGESEEAGSNSETDTSVIAAALPDRVKISDIKKYLYEPFKFMVEHKLSADDDSAEEENAEFEPIFFDRLTQSALRKRQVMSALKKESQKDFQNELTTELKITNALPDSFFGKSALKHIFETRQPILDAIRELIPEETPMVFGESRMWLIKKAPGITDKNWYVTGETVWYNEDFVQTKIIQTLDLNNSENYFGGYITALLLIADRPEEERATVYTANLNVIKYKDSAPIPSTVSFSASPEEARLVLNKIYRSIYIEAFHVCAPWNTIYKDLNRGSDEEPVSFDAFQSSLTDTNNNGCWAYFSKADYFDTTTDVGYDEENFDELWEITKQHQKELILFLNPVKEGEE